MGNMVNILKDEEFTTMKKLNITKEQFEKSKYFTKKYGTLKFVSESGRLFKTDKGQVLRFDEGLSYTKSEEPTLDDIYRAVRREYNGKLFSDNFIKVNADKSISLTNCCAVAGLGPAAIPEVVEALKRINPKGTVKENRRRDGSFAYYLSEPVRDNDGKGIGPFIWASLEMEALGYNTDSNY